MLAFTIYCGAGHPQKLKTQIDEFIYNEHFMHLLSVGCHGPQKNLNTKQFRRKKFDANISQIMVNNYHHT